MHITDYSASFVVSMLLSLNLLKALVLVMLAPCQASVMSLVTANLVKTSLLSQGMVVQDCVLIIIQIIWFNVSFFGG